MRRVRIALDSDGRTTLALDGGETAAPGTHAAKVRARLARIRGEPLPKAGTRPRRREVPCAIIGCPCCWPRYQLTLPGAPVPRELGTEDGFEGPGDGRKLGRIWSAGAWPKSGAPVWRAEVYQATRGEGPIGFLEISDWHIQAAAINPRPPLAYVDKKGDRAREAREAQSAAQEENYSGDNQFLD